MMKKYLLTLFLIFSFITPCFAANWYWIGNDDGVNYFVDNDSVVKNQHQAFVVTKLVFPSGDYKIIQMRMNHDDQTYKFTSLYEYDSHNRMKYTYNYSTGSNLGLTIHANSFTEAVYHSLWSD